MSIVEWLIWRVKNFGNRFAGTFGNTYRVMYYGTIVKMNYSNYKHDPSPLILVLFSGIKYTHALNLNYLSVGEKQYLARLIYALKTGRQVIDPHTLYLLLKRDVYNNIVRKSYRTYFSNRIIQPRMVSAGWTQLDRLQYPYNDPFIIGLNKYLNNQNINKNPVQVSYYNEELKDRVISAINSTPVGRGSIINTTPLQQATVGTVSATRGM